MASPTSFEGLSKIQIKQRLTEMRKQYELMQKKLEKSEKAAKAKSHVKKKIADYKLNQSRGGSPECTLKAPKEQDVEPLQESPLLPTASRRDRQSSGRDKAGSGKKNIKRRSVSFHLAERTRREQSAKSKEEASRSTTNNEAGIRTPSCEASHVDAVSHGSPVRFVERTGNLLADEVTPGKQDPCTSEKSPAQEKAVLVALALSRGEKSLQNTLAKTMTERSVRTVKDGSPKLGHVRYDPSSQEAISSENPSTEEGFSQESNIRTPPDDTQFDLFADTPTKIPDTIEGPTGSDASHKNTSQVKLFMSNVSEPFDKASLERNNRKVVKDLDASLSMNTNQVLDSARDELDSQSSIKCVLNADNHSETGQRNKFHATYSDSPASQLLKRTEVESSEESTKQFVKRLQAGAILPQEQLEEDSEQCCINSSMEDPDVIPGTYSEEVPAMPKSAHFEARNNQRQSDAPLKREWTNRRSIEGQTAPLNALQDEQEIEDNSCAQVLKPKQQDQHEVEILETNVVADDVLSKASEVASKACETNPDSKGTSKGRRKSQRSIENLSMDDVSLKDFVLSQQSSQEGTHSWIDGLMYPAEYYVRKTRSMSKPSPSNHSAPVGHYGYPCKQSRSRSVERPFFSDPLIQVGANESVTIVNEISETLTPKETSRCQEASSAMQPEPCISSIKAGKEPTSAGKMKVSRTSAASQKRRGRPPKSRRKVESEGIQSPIEKNLEVDDVVQCQTGGTEGNQSSKDQTKSKEIDSESNDKTHEKSTFKETTNVAIVCAEIEMSKVHEKLMSTQVSHNPLESQYTQLEVPSAIPMPRLFGSPERIASSYTGGHNPLESQFTQMQIPSGFALPTVFGSPGNQSQTHVSLQLGSPSSPCQRSPGNEIGSPLEAKAISHQDRNVPCDVNQQKMNVYLQDHPEHQWESQAYLADMVSEAAVPNCPDPSSAHATSTILFQEDHDYEGTPIHRDQGCEVVSKSSQSLHDDIRRASQNSDVSMVSILSQETVRAGPDGAKIYKGHMEPLPKDRSEVVPDNPSKKGKRTGLQENVSGVPLVTTVVPSVATSAPSVSTDAPELSTGVPVDHTDIPSSLCSNVDQGSPFADAATGTPPEVADIPLVQSQCTDPTRHPSQDEEFEQGERPVGGISVRGTSVFQFRGCIEHTIKETSSILSLTSSRIVVNGANRSATTVQYTSKIFVWLHDADEGCQEFKLLSTWGPEKIDEEIHLIHPYSGAEGCFEAVVIIRDGTASESIRLIQLDIEQGTRQENAVWTARDLGQRTCTALCVNPGRWIAVVVNNVSGGSDVLYSHLDELYSQSEPEVLPASDALLNSLTAVESSPDMIVGLTNMKALLWHLPTGQLVQEFSLVSHDVTDCIQATAEFGLLFLVAYKKEASHQHARLNTDQVTSCCLLALNPATGRSSRLLSYTAHCMKPGTRILDVSVREGTLAACLSTGHVCIWDLYSSKLLTSSQSDSDHKASLVNLQDTGSMLIASGHCVQMFERNI